MLMQTMEERSTERMDERFDDVSAEFHRIDKRFENVEADIRELRRDLKSTGQELRQEIKANASEIRKEMKETQRNFAVKSPSSASI